MAESRFPSKKLEVGDVVGGGFGGRTPYPQSKVAARHAGKKEAAEARLNSPENLAKREARKESFQPKTKALRFNKGGMVKGAQCRDYGKK